MMEKDPAFLLYSKDFLTGVADMTMEERGQYITLMCLQHQKGHLSGKIIGINVGTPSADVLAKFRQDENGELYNEKLEEVITKRAEHGKKQRKKALEGWEKRRNQSQTDAKPYAENMPLVNAIANAIGNENKERGVGETQEYPPPAQMLETAPDYIAMMNVFTDAFPTYPVKVAKDYPALWAIKNDLEKVKNESWPAIVKFIRGDPFFARQSLTQIANQLQSVIQSKNSEKNGNSAKKPFGFTKPFAEIIPEGQRGQL